MTAVGADYRGVAFVTFLIFRIGAEPAERRRGSSMCD